MKKFVLMIMVVGLVGMVGCKKDNDMADDVDVTEQIVVNPDYVAIDWERANLESADDSTGTYTITFDGEEMPGIRVGSIIAIDRDTMVNYRYVVSVEWSGNRVNLTTVEAYLTDIFYDSGFTLATSSDAKKGGKGRKGKVIYAEAAYVTGEDGKYHMVRLNGGGKASTEFTHNLWQSPTFNYDGEVLYESNNMKIWMERMNMSMSIDMEMYMNFGGRTELEVVGDAISRYRSKALRVEAAFVGKFETEQEIRCKVTGQCAWTPDYDLWKHNLFRPIPIRFIAGGVPIVLTLRCDLFRQVEVTASGEMEFYTGVEDRAEGRVGFEWEQSGGMTPVSSFRNNFEFTPPTVEGRGTVQAKVWAFPRVSVMLYDVVGPSVDFMPYLATRVSGGFREQMLGTSNDYCAWSLDCNTGLDLRCGLSARFFGYEVGNWSTGKWNFMDINLYHSPKRVEHLTGEGRVGERRRISFAVYDQNNLLGRETVTPLPQLVKFEARGGLSSEYGIASGGVVTVDWTAAENDVLYAKLYDISGNVMSMARVESVGGGDEPGGGEEPGGGGFDENGASNAVFTVAEGRTVRFSLGNLQYQASTGTWRFAEHQYDTVGAANSNISSSYSGWIDLFGWGTSGWNSGAVCYQPWATSNWGPDYYPGGSYTNSLTGAYANADWGVYNRISNGGNQAGMWRTLTKDEWDYLLTRRAASTINGVANARCAPAVVNGTNGVVLFPDNFTMPGGMSYPSGINDYIAPFNSNTYTASQWSQMEGAGCIFLPAAGGRFGTWVPDVGTYGRYWSSTYDDEGCAYGVNFYDGHISEYIDNRYYGQSVRLVRD